MEGLGRHFNVIPIAASRGLSMVGCRGITFVTTGSDTFTVTFAGSYASPGTLVCNVYKSSATNGTAAWVKDNTLISTNTVVSGGAITTCFYIPGDFLPDTKAYIKLTPSGGGLVTAILHDLYTQRTPPNLAIVSA
jgi:hypothetical protein